MGNLLLSSKIFSNLRKMSENVRLSFGTIFENLRKVVGNLRKIVKNVVISMFIYYIKVSGIASGNNLIKTIRYPHMWRYRWFQWHQVCLLNCTWHEFAGVSSKHLWVFLESLRQSSAIFGNSRNMFGNVRLVFATILENLRKSSECGIVFVFVIFEGK